MLGMVTIEIVINSTHLQQDMRVTISCRYALSDMGRSFWFLVKIIDYRQNLPQFSECRILRHVGLQA